jgi:hypothetical protein
VHISLEKETKGKLYNSVLKAVIIYVSEGWNLAEECERKLRTFEWNVQKKIYGPTRSKEECQTKHNYKLYDLYNAPEIVKTLKLGRLKWPEHPTRANVTSTCRKLTCSMYEGTKRTGRPSLRWLDSVEKDLRILGIGDWITKALDRNLWRRSRPIQGCSARKEEEEEAAYMSH